MQSLNDIFYNISYLKQCSVSITPTFDNLIQYKPFVELQLFRQGYSIEGERDFWIMIEAWSDKEDLMVKFGDFCSKELALPFDIV